MGSCVSVHKDSESAMKIRLVFGSSKTDKLVTPSPLNKNDTKVSDLQLKSQTPAVTTFPDFGSKEETFFDSQPWLDSDCEDDFLSVNGDFTPSRGNTPVHHLARNLTGNRTPAYFQQSSPTDKKKRLSELFEESLRSDQDQNGQNAEEKQNGTNTKKETASTGAQLPPRSTPGTPYASVCSSERTPSGLLKSDVKTSKSAQCCLPRLLSSRSFNGRRSRMSPARNVG
ncbi:uncharacterized protein At3g27210 [Nicotiana tomentosiformis]|uniref:uncharacterized protein At3g27210 n=1 Tax=Nicotiana tomentosiformis TaxID=4098 RepID=UPI00051BAFD5|nr:uncharacterized protein At3g27210 [Nicotiana tomentosiformis]